MNNFGTWSGVTCMTNCQKCQKKEFNEGAKRYDHRIYSI